MKKIFPVLFILSLLSCSKPKPVGLFLKVQFLPDNTYYISTIRGTETVITYSGQEIAMRKLKSMRIKNPTISKVKNKTETELKTGKLTTDHSCPISLKYIKTLSLNGKNEIPEGTEIQGEIEGKGLPAFYKVVSDKLSIDQRIQLLQTVKNTFEQFDFPEQQLKIGDQFSTNRSASMPMEGSTIDIVITTNYKLLSIKNDQAQFEISQNYLMTPKTMDNSFKGTGSGKGQLSYDIINGLITEYSIKTEMVMNKKLDYYEFDLKTKNEFSQTTRLSKP